MFNFVTRTLVKDRSWFNYHKTDKKRIFLTCFWISNQNLKDAVTKRKIVVLYTVTYFYWKTFNGAKKNYRSNSTWVWNLPKKQHNRALATTVFLTLSLLLCLNNFGLQGNEMGEKTLDFHFSGLFNT